MTANKTQRTDASVDDFIASIKDETTRTDCEKLIEIMQSITRSPPSMWGPSIVGFGDYHYRYATGREGDWFLCGFSPRKQNLTLYVTGCVAQFDELVSQLGKVKHGKSCIYVKTLDDVDLPTLKKLIRTTVRELKKVAGSH